MSSGFRLTWVLVLLASGFGRPAQAEATPGEAAAHEQAGVEAYRRGDHRRALEEFRRSHQADGDPGTLFNIAQALAQLGDYRQALAYYRRYLAEAPASARQRPSALHNVEEIRRRLAARNRAQAGRDKARPTESIVVVRAGEGAPLGLAGDSSRLRLQLDPQLALLGWVAATPGTSRTVTEPTPAAEPRETKGRTDADSAGRTAVTPEQPPKTAPASLPRWSTLRLTSTIGFAALGLVALGAGVGFLLESNGLAQRVLASLNDQDAWRLARDVVLPEMQGMQRSMVVSFSIAGVAMIASTVCALWPRSPLSLQARSGAVSLSIAPAGFGLVAGGRF